MKKYNIILIAFLVLLNCGPKDDFEPLSDLVVPDLFTPSLNVVDEESIGNTIAISIDDFSSFSDISQGVVSRSWIINEGSRFLKDDFTRSDSLNLRDFIDPEFNRSNWKPTVHVLFQEAGEKTVTLNNFFPQPVTYLGQMSVLDDNNGLWRLSNTLTYDVYNKINAATSITNTTTGDEVVLTADQNPSSTDTSGFTTLTIEAGTTLNFKDLSIIGRPDSRVWKFESGTPTSSQDQEIDVLYNRPGEYSASITINRNKRGKLLFFAEQTKTLPVIVKVIPSSQPFVISANAMAVDDNDTNVGTKILSFPVNGIVESVTNTAANFTADIVNGAFTSSINPVSVRVSPTNESVVELIFNETLYNSDSVTISYNGTAITSIDGRTLEPFTIQTVDNLFKNFLNDTSNPSFEDASTVPNNANLVGFSTFRRSNADGSLRYLRSTERASDGNASVRANIFFPISNNLSSLTNRVLVNSSAPSGTYRIELDVYVETGSTIKNMFLAGPGLPPGGPLNFDLESIAKGEWVTLQEERTYNTPVAGNFNFAFNNGNNPLVTGTQIVFFDNLKFIGLEQRP